MGVVSDSGGVLRAKAVPASRIESFATTGMGASLTWPVFCVDNGIAMTEELNVVGDLRLTADLDTAVVLDRGFGWAAADVRDQEGARSPYCWRDVVRRQVDRLSAMGFEARVGNELEFGLLDEEGNPLGERHGWPCYGAGAFSEVSDFAADLCERMESAGVPAEQVHAEYGQGQFELSLPPRDPLTAADNVLLARAVVGRVTRDHCLRATFSPAPFAGQSGNGAHMHLSRAARVCRYSVAAAGRRNDRRGRPRRRRPCASPPGQHRGACRDRGFRRKDAARSVVGRLGLLGDGEPRGRHPTSAGNLR